MALPLAPHDAAARAAWAPRGGVPATPQERNRYASARNNPLRYTDPTGHCIGWIWGAPDCRFAGWDPAHWRYSDALDAVQTGFDVAGLIPGAGEPCDGLNALISLARGDPAGAALAAAALVPGAGMGATSAKLAARYGDEAAAAAAKIASGGMYKLMDPETQVVQYVGRTKNLEQRRLQHARDPVKRGLAFEVDWQTDEYAVQRGREQMLYDTYHPPLNRIRPIRPNNPRWADYLDAARRHAESLQQR